MQQLETDLPQQLGIMSGDNAALMGGGLGTIQDEADSNQDSDFSGDDEDKPIKDSQQNNGENSDDLGDNLNAQGAEDEETGATGKVGKGKPDNTEAGGGTGADGAAKDLANNEKADKTTKKKKGGEGTKKKKTK